MDSTVLSNAFYRDITRTDTSIGNFTDVYCFSSNKAVFWSQQESLFLSIGNSFTTWSLEQVLLWTVLSRRNGPICGSRITCQKSVFLSNRQDNEALIIIRLFSNAVRLPGLFFFFFFDFVFWLEYFIHLESDMVTYVTINQMVKFDRRAIYQGDKLITFRTVYDNWVSLHLEPNILFLNSVFK